MGSQPYGRPLSTVFADSLLHTLDEDGDPTMASLQFIDYRYMRFFYHPIEDKFSLINGWKDPAWTNAKVMREGLDADERDSREQLFERNAIEIHQKTIPQLLVDEVGSLFMVSSAVSDNFRPSIPSTSSKWQVCFFGLWMNTIITLSVSSSFHSSA